MFENPSKGMQANNVTTNVPKILVLKSSSEQIFSENCRWVPLHVVQYDDKICRKYFSCKLVTRTVSAVRIQLSLWNTAVI